MREFGLVNSYNIYLLFPLFILSYFIVAKINAKVKKKNFVLQITGTKNNEFKINKRFFEKLKSSKLFKKTDERLRKQGYPLGFKAFSYFVFKIVLGCICFTAGFQNYNSASMGIILGIAGFSLLDIYIFFNKTIRNNAINNDLMNIADCLSLQLSANMVLGDALKGLFEICENKELKKAMIRLSTEYSFSGHNIEKAADEFNNTFEMIEIDLFCLALKQQITHGNSREALMNLSEILREGYLDRINIKTKMKMIYVVAGVVVIMADIVLLTMFPIFVDVGEGMKMIFN